MRSCPRFGWFDLFGRFLPNFEDAVFVVLGLCFGGAFEFHCQFGQFVTMVEERKLLMEAYVRESLLEMYETNRQWLGNLEPEVMEEASCAIPSSCPRRPATSSATPSAATL